MPPKRKLPSNPAPESAEKRDTMEPERYKITDVMEPDEENDRYVEDGDLLDVEDVMVEPTPLEKRLRENGRYNQGDWSSEELKKLYDGITTYGTSQKAIEYICSRLGSRSLEEVQSKLEEIREMVSEHRVERFSDEVTKWTTLGYKNVQPPARLQLIDKSGRPVVGWPSAISRVDKMRKGFDQSTMANVLAKNFARLAPKNAVDVKITNSVLSPFQDKTAKLDWSRISEFIETALAGKISMPGVNAMEASVILSLLDDVEKEADYLPENYRAVIKGLMSNIQMNDLRDFEPDIPCTEISAAQAFLDPLRTRANGIPEGGITITPTNIDPEILKMRNALKAQRNESKSLIPTIDDLFRADTPQPTVENADN